MTEIGKRVVLAMNAQGLPGGPIDTARIHSLLIRPDRGCCDPDSSPRPLSNCPDKGSFREIWDEAIHACEDADQLVFYFSGHGRRPQQTFCIQAGPDPIRDCVPFENLIREIEIKRLRAILIVDACFSGETTKGPSEVECTESVPELPEGIAILASSGADQVSEVSHNQSKQPGSIFTHLLCEAIESGLDKPTPDGLISVEDAARFINLRLSDEPQYASYRQRARFKVANTSDRIWLSINPAANHDQPPQTESAGQSRDSEAVGPPSYVDRITPVLSFAGDIVSAYREQLKPDVLAKHPLATVSNEAFLDRIGVLSERRLTVAGVLLFTTKANTLCPTALVKCSIYSSKQPAPEHTVSKKDIDGPLQGQILEAYHYVLANIDSLEGHSSSTPKRTRVYRFPTQCIRELISNAISHRDYEDHQRCVQIRLYSDRLEIGSPGPWVGKQLEEGRDYRLQELRQESTLRNPRIAHSISDLALFEGRAEGIAFALNECQVCNAPAPLVRQVDSMVYVTVFPRDDWGLIRSGKSHVVRVISDNKKASGFIVAPGVVLTCRHVVETSDLANRQGPPVARLCVERQDSTEALSVHRVILSDKFDLALLFLESPIDSDVLLLSGVSSKDIDLLGDRLYALGYPPESDSVLRIEPGASIVTEVQDGGLTRFSMLGGMEGDFSGAPVHAEVDGRQYCVGVVSSSGSRSASTTLVSSNDAARFLDEVMGPEAARQAQIPRSRVKIDGPDVAVSVDHLPATGNKLFGRVDETQHLDQAWREADTRVLCVVGFGGMGKSSLVKSWLAQMSASNYCGARRVFAWSFYSQGATDLNASSDVFIHRALEWFGGDPDTGSSVLRAEKLTELVCQDKSLLILDGLEPLQFALGEHRGRLKDDALRTLLVGIAARPHAGLCIVTSRVDLTDLGYLVGKGVRRLELGALGEQAGCELLKSLGVVGSMDDLSEAVADFGGHALALTLLGNYLRVTHNGDIAYSKKVDSLLGDSDQAGHAHRVMRSYEVWLGKGIEVAFLRLLSLFDRPVAMEEIQSLLAAPVIDGLTDKLRPLSKSQLLGAVDRLRAVGLLATERSPQARVDCHPLVRSYFAEQLQADNPSAWEAGTSRVVG